MSLLFLSHAQWSPVQSIASILFKTDVLNESRHFFTCFVSPYWHDERNFSPSLMSANDISYSLSNIRWEKSFRVFDWLYFYISISLLSICCIVVIRKQNKLPFIVIKAFISLRRSRQYKRHILLFGNYVLIL